MQSVERKNEKKKLNKSLTERQRDIKTEIREMFYLRKIVTCELLDDSLKLFVARKKLSKS